MDLDFILILVVILGASALVTYTEHKKQADRVEGTPQPRYDCEDNSDTTKGHYKGVLTHCVPVKITRTM